MYNGKGLAIVLALAAAGGGAAQTPEYRITDLGALGFLPAPINADTGLGTGVFGMNDKGEVAFAIDVTGSGDLRAHVWLPEAAYGLPAGVHDLASLSLFPGTPQPSIAHGINDQGQVVGQAGGVDDATGQAVVWNLDPANRELILVGAQLAFDWSRGFAINSDEPATMVGEYEKLDVCRSFCEDGFSEPQRPFVRSFRLRIEDQSPDPGTQLPAHEELTNDVGGVSMSCDPSTFARDVNLQGSVAGYSGDRELDGIPCVDNEEPPCEGKKDGVVWLAPPAPEFVDDLGSQPDEWGSEVRGINDVGQFGQSVGWGFESFVLPCRVRALFWETPTSSPFNLGTVMPDGQAGNESRAEAINGLGSPQVVGWNFNQNRAIRWTRDAGSSWSAVDLNDCAIIPPCWVFSCMADPMGCLCPEIRLREAYDVNDGNEDEGGWILAFGDGDTNATGIQSHAYVLTPVGDCLADLDGDDNVGFADLNILYGQWGDCQIGEICLGDLNFSCRVGFADLNILLAAYGPCSGQQASSSGLSPALAAAWTSGGGAEALVTGEITVQQVHECMQQPSQGSRFTALMSLIAQSAQE